ncbi:MAG: hypothetical protein WKF58_13575 [Ilumatobacteraceae bacterium]
MPWSPFVRFEQVATLAASRSFQLRSAFRPTYNMAANLIRNYEPDEARHLLTMSFAQFQADREIVTLEARLERLRRRHNELRDAAESSYGDIWAYRESTSRAERRREHDDIDVSLEALRPGSVIWVNRGKYAGPGVVISTVATGDGLAGVHHHCAGDARDARRRALHERTRRARTRRPAACDTARPPGVPQGRRPPAPSRRRRSAAAVAPFGAQLLGGRPTTASIRSRPTRISASVCAPPVTPIA